MTRCIAKEAIVQNVSSKLARKNDMFRIVEEALRKHLEEKQE